VPWRKKKQIPFGNDRKKSNGKSNGNGKSSGNGKSNGNGTGRKAMRPNENYRAFTG
jgi:hypothetical protein